MIPAFTFKFPTAIEFGVGKSKEIIDAVQAEKADKVLLVTDKQIRSLGLIDPIYDS